MPPRRAVSAPQLLTVSAAAELLSVSSRTVLNWINEDRIPYLELPGAKPMYRIPLQPLLATLRSISDLAGELEHKQESGSDTAEHDLLRHNG